MSTLQISLAVVGIILLGLIMAYNAWNNRRHTPKRPQYAEGEARVADNGARFDPALDGVDVTNLPTPPLVSAGADSLVAGSAYAGRDYLAEPTLEGLDTGTAIEPSIEPMPAVRAESAQAEAETAVLEAAAPAAPVAMQLPTAERKQALDGLIDAIAPIRLEQPVSGDAALQVQPTTRRAGSKQFRIEGLNVTSQLWESVRAGQRYSAFQGGVQLANRLGALNEIEFSEFVAKVQGFADALNAAVEIPDMLHEVARARELDQFASEHDAQLSFLLRPRRAAWSPGYIEQQGAGVGFVAASMPGRMVLPSDFAGHAPLLSLVYDAQAAQADNLDQTAVHQVWLSLDVPQVPRSEEPFARLRQVVQQLCEAMDGMLCDQNGYQLLPQVLEPIEADLQKLYDKLDSRELSAGSMLARRLFN